MKLLLCFLFLVGSLFGQATTAVPITAVVYNTDISDIYAWMHMQYADPAIVPTLTAPMLIGATSATLTSTAGLSAGGGGVMIEAEGIQYTGISGNQITGLIRGQQMTTAAAHATAVPVHNLSITTPDLFMKYCIANQIKAIRVVLGINSATVGAAQAAILANIAIINAFPVIQ